MPNLQSNSQIARTVHLYCSTTIDIFVFRVGIAMDIQFSSTITACSTRICRQIRFHHQLQSLSLASIHTRNLIHFFYAHLSVYQSVVNFRILMVKWNSRERESEKNVNEFWDGHFLISIDETFGHKSELLK